MNEEVIYKTLKELLPKLEGLNFGMLGTGNLLLQGIKGLSPNDLDFLTLDTDLKKISELFDSSVTNDSGYLETEFEFMGQEIHFVSAENNLVREVDFNKDVIQVEVRDIFVPCVKLESEVEAYRKMGREKDVNKVELVEAFLNKN